MQKPRALGTLRGAEGSYAAHLRSRFGGSTWCDRYSGCTAYIKCGAGRKRALERVLSRLGRNLRLRGLFAQELYDHSKRCSGDGHIFLGYGSVGSAVDGHPWVPLRREVLGSGPSASCRWWVEYGMRCVVALQ